MSLLDHGVGATFWVVRRISARAARASELALPMLLVFPNWMLEMIRGATLPEFTFGGCGARALRGAHAKPKSIPSTTATMLLWPPNLPPPPLQADTPPAVATGPNQAAATSHLGRMTGVRAGRRGSKLRAAKSVCFASTCDRGRDLPARCRTRPGALPTRTWSTCVSASLRRRANCLT